MAQSFPERLLELCRADYITPTKLATLTGIPQATISNLIRTDADARKSTLVALADYFGISVDELIDHQVKPREKPLAVRQQSVTITLSPEEGAELKKMLEERMVKQEVE